MAMILRLLRLFIYFSVVIYVAHLYYIKKITDDAFFVEDSKHQYSSPELDFRIGYFHNRPKESSFYLYDHQKKTPDIIRIGVFGGSYAYGDDVGEQADYPTILGEILGPKYQVLNFGMSWFSLAQSYIFWDFYQEFFDLDIVVYGPRGLWLESNLTFNHTQDRYPSYLRSRFVLQNGNLREIAPFGSTRQEAQKAYYSIWPPKQYWDYDLRPPSILRSFSYFTDTYYQNPFYHHPNPSSEHHQIIKAIFENMASKSKKLIIISDEVEYDATLKEVATRHNNTTVINFSDHLSFGVPFATPSYHSSVYGNARIAYMLKSVIEGENIRYLNNLPQITFESDLELIKQWPVKNTAPIGNIHLTLNGNVIGDIVPAKNRFEAKTKRVQPEPSGFLLAFICPEQELFNSLLLNLPPETFAELDIEQWSIVYQHSSHDRFLAVRLNDCHFNPNFDTLYLKKGLSQQEWLNQFFQPNPDSPYIYKEGWVAMEPLYSTFKFGVLPTARHDHLVPDETNVIRVEINGRSDRI